MNRKIISHKKRAKRVRSKIIGKTNLPRLSIYRSNKHIYGQVIDDSVQKTLVSANDSFLKDEKLTKSQKAERVGQLLADRLIKSNIKQVVFDRGGFQYNGRIKKLAEAVVKGGVKI